MVPSRAALVVVAALLASQALAADAVECPVTYQAEADVLSVAARAVPLRTLLGCVSGATGISIAITPGLDRPVTLSAARSPDAVFKQLLREENYAVVYEGSGTARRIKRITILPKGSEDSGAVEVLMPIEASAGGFVGGPVFTPEQREELQRRQARREARGQERKGHGPASKEAGAASGKQGPAEKE